MTYFLNYGEVRIFYSQLQYLCLTVKYKNDFTKFNSVHENWDPWKLDAFTGENMKWDALTDIYFGSFSNDKSKMLP